MVRITISQVVSQALFQYKTTLQQQLPEPGRDECVIVRTPVRVMLGPASARVQVHAPQRHLGEAFQGHKVLLWLQSCIGQAPDPAKNLWPMQTGKEGVDGAV
jgi:hypothetical protein